jgi:hypothetical protein
MTEKTEAVASTEQLGPLAERLRDWADDDYVLQAGELPAVRRDMAAAANELDRLRARVLELEAVHEDASGAVLQERARFAELMTDLRVLATCCQWPDGDGATVNAQMWAEDWVRRLDGPNLNSATPLSGNSDATVR